MTQLLPVILGAAFVIAAIWLAGRAVAPRLAPSLSFGVGSILLSYVVFVLMQTHHARPRAFGGILLIAIVLGILRRREVRFGHPPLWMLGVCAPFAVWYLVNALAPEVQADPNVYHLRPAIDALRLGGFSSQITFYDRMPQAMELLFVPAYAFGGSSAAKLIHFAFLIATLPVISHIGRGLGSPGHIAAAIYFCTPIVGLDGTAAFNDAALVYFAVAAVALALDDEPVYAGLCGGFCYAIKMTGLISILVVIALFAARKQWKSALLSGAVAAVMISPWIIRNLAQTGNPFAPFLNAWFPNAYFNVLTEQALMSSLRNYGISFWQRFPEVLVGARLHGLIGPAFVVAPLAILAVRRRSGVLLILLTAAFSLSWWLNSGTRFLMPALPFLALAICIAVPPRAAVALFLVHAATSWPDVVSAYSPQTLRLDSFPWKAALRVETEEDYLKRVSLDYIYAKMAEHNTPPNARILDLLGAHSVFLDRELIGSWRSALGVRSFEALDFARDSTLSLLESTFEPRAICGYRVVETSATNGPWNVHSLELRLSGKRVEGGRASASTNPWELPLAFDRNLVSRWSTRKPAERGYFLQVDVPQPVFADGLQLLYPTSDRRIDMRFEICEQGQWERVATHTRPGPALNFRPAATDTLRKARITHILASANSDGIGILGERLVNEADLWDLEVISNVDAVYLLKLR